MKNVTLISDWKLRDPYIGMFKGRLTTVLPDIRMFDITHSVDYQNIQQTAFILQNSYTSFPEGTVHIILTGSLFSSPSLPVAVLYDGHYFLGEDNGIFSLLLGTEINWTAFRFPESEEGKPTISNIIRMAEWIFSGQLEERSVSLSALKRKLSYVPDYSPVDNKLTGRIVYIDSFCNAVTDIPAGMFTEVAQKRVFTALVGRGRHLQLSRFHSAYQDQEEDVYLVANRMGYIEITMNHGNIAALADLHIGDVIEINFK